MGPKATISGVEIFFITLLVVIVLAVLWFAGLVVYRLMRSSH